MNAMCGTIDMTGTGAAAITGQMVWAVVRVNRPKNPNRRTALLGAEYQSYRNRAGQVCKRPVKGTGQRVSVPELILKRAGFKVFQPMQKVWRQVNPRQPDRVLVSQPMLAGWMFVGWSADQERFCDLLSLDVVHGLLGDAGRPALISERKVKSLMRQWSGKTQDPDYLRYMRAGSEFREGDMVEIAAGPFVGFSAQVQKIRGAQAEILISIFGKDTPAEMDIFELKPA